MQWQHKISELAEPVLATRHYPLLIKEAAWKALRFAVRCGRSNPISFILRPIFSHQRLHTLIGLTMAGLAAAFTLTTPFVSFAGDNTGGQVTLNVLPEGDIPLETLEAVVMPVKVYRVTQGYWAWHPGLDLAGPKGEPVNPIMNGTVKEVKRDKFAYGNHIRVTHSNNYESLYAHLNTIDVVEGQVVKTDTQIGTLGSTGRSTGPHLHLEVRDEDYRLLNPKTLLDIK